MITMLAKSERTVGELVDAFDITFPAVSYHLRVLRRARLVQQRRRGAQRIYRLRQQSLRAVRDWIGQHID